MKAVIHSRHGNSEVLQVTTLERPMPQKNEVLIRVMAAGLDYGQWHLMAGKPYAVRAATGLTKPKQRVLGMDVSRVVQAVGDEVRGSKVGDSVDRQTRGRHFDPVMVDAFLATQDHFKAIAYSDTHDELARKAGYIGIAKVQSGAQAAALMSRSSLLPSRTASGP